MAETDFHRYEEGAIDGVSQLIALGSRGDAVNSIVLSSIAISLKRIADALDETNEYGERAPAAIGGGIARALREHG